MSLDFLVDLCCKLEGPGFDYRCHWIFHLTFAVSRTVVGLIPDVIGAFSLPNISSSNMALW
jgi:hypothetical protein